MVRKTRNDTEFYYCQFIPDMEYRIVDENGNETGETVPAYGEPVLYWANVSPAAGAAQFEFYGNMGNFDKAIVTRDMDCPFDENTVFFIDRAPEYTTYHIHAIPKGETEAVEMYYDLPKYDYLVKRVARGLDAVAIAVSKVDVG